MAKEIVNDKIFLMASIVEKSITIDGKQFFYLESEQASKISIVFLHGWLNCSLIYRETMLRLDGFRTIAIDLPGFGFSSPLKEENTIEQVAEHLFKFIQRLELKNILLVGASYSSLIALYLAVMYPATVRGVAFQTLPYKINNFLTRWQKLMIKFSKIKPLFWIIWQFFKSPIYIYLYKNVYCKDIRCVDEKALKEIIEHSKRLSPQDASESFRSILDADEMTIKEIETLRKNKTPYLFILGDADDKFSIPEGIDNSKITIINKGTHRLIVERPQEFSQIIRDFANSMASNDL